jgi:hypothetical protein
MGRPGSARLFSQTAVDPVAYKQRSRKKVKRIFCRLCTAIYIYLTQPSPPRPLFPCRRGMDQIGADRHRTPALREASNQFGADSNSAFKKFRAHFHFQKTILNSILSIFGCLFKKSHFVNTLGDIYVHLQYFRLLKLTSAQYSGEFFRPIGGPNCCIAAFTRACGIYGHNKSAFLLSVLNLVY